MADNVSEFNQNRAYNRSPAGKTATKDGQRYLDPGQS